MSTMDNIYVSPVIREDEWNNGSFRVDPRGYGIQYKVEDDFTETLGEFKDDRRAIRCSDLLSLLKDRNYNLTDSKGIDPISGELGFISGYDVDGCASKIEVITNSISQNDINEIMSFQYDLLNMQVGNIPGTFIENGTGDYSYPDKYGFRENYYNFRLILDLVTKSSVLNVQSINDLIYTDTLDLNRVLNDNSSYESLSVRLGIKFTLIDSSDIVRLKEFILPYGIDFNCKVDNKVNMEYVGNVIRLFHDTDVLECVIDYCHILGRLK